MGYQTLEIWIWIPWRCAYDSLSSWLSV